MTAGQRQAQAETGTASCKSAAERGTRFLAHFGSLSTFGPSATTLRVQ